MKIDKPNGVPLELVKSTSKTSTEASDSKKASGFSGDKVNTGVSESLQSLEKAFAQSPLQSSEVHSNLDHARIESLLHSFEQVEAKRPSMDEEQLFALVDNLSQKMSSEPKNALAAFSSPDSQRVFDLLS